MLIVARTKSADCRRSVERMTMTGRRGSIARQTSIPWVES